LAFGEGANQLSFFPRTYTYKIYVLKFSSEAKIITMIFSLLIFISARGSGIPVDLHPTSIKALSFLHLGRFEARLIISDLERDEIFT